MGRCKSLGCLKLFLWYVPHLSGDSILYFHILSFLRLTIGEWLQSDGCSMADTLFLSEFPQAHQLMLEGCNHWCYLRSINQFRHLLSNFNLTKKALKIIPLYYEDSKNRNFGEYEEKYIWHNTEKEKGENNTHMMTAIMQFCVWLYMSHWKQYIRMMTHEWF